MRRVVLLIALNICASCRRDDGSDGDTPQALPDGTYDLEAPTCLSSGAPPRYPSPNYKLALRTFDELLSNTLTLRGGEGDFTASDADCKLTATRPVYRNTGGVLSFRVARQLVFEPKGCLMTLLQGTARYEVGAGHGGLLDASDDQREEIPYVVENGAEPNSLKLTSYDSDELNAIWAAYGCASVDRITHGLKPR